MRVRRSFRPIVAAALLLFAQAAPALYSQTVNAVPTAPAGAAPQKSSPLAPGGRATNEGSRQHLFFWKAARGDAVLYLLAAIHLAGPDIYPLNPAITAAFERSNALIVEVDIQALSPVELRNLMLKYAYYPANDDLTHHLTPELLKQVLAATGKAGLSQDTVERMRPWLLDTVLSTVDTGNSHLEATYGVDNHFLGLAHGSGMKIVSLETAAEQLSLISSLPVRLQIRSLKETVSGLRGEGSDLGEIYNAWKSGDLERFRAVVVKPFQHDAEMRQLYQELFVRRNERWAVRVDRLFGFPAAPAGAATTESTSATGIGGEYTLQRGPAFLVVGAGHLIGPDNLRVLLEARGWKVSRVAPEATLSPSANGL